MRRRLFQLRLGAACLLASTGMAAADPPHSISVTELRGLADDDLTAALATFRSSCAAAIADTAPTRPPVAAPAALRSVCASLPPAAASQDAALAFFTEHFVARRVPGPAFFTGYYEPVVAGSLTPTAAFRTPLLAPPADLVSITPGSIPGIDPTLKSARRLPDGRLAALPDRAAIESGRLGTDARPLVYVASPVDAFFIQVQGSARIRLSDGSLRRLVFAGRNGYPYTSIGKVLVQRLGIPPDRMGMAQLRAWIRDHGQGEGDAGMRLMQENRSYIFFRFGDSLPSQAGPIGGEGISLTPERSIAIDKSVWPYGLPFYLDTTRPDATPFRRLMVAQDTGSAIIGPARADIFFGSGEAASNEAGPMRQAGTLYVLWPKPPSHPATSHAGSAK